MRIHVFAFLALASAFGQQFEVLNSNLPGLVARDSQSNWIIVDGFNPNLAKLRVRKFSPDLTQTLFDRQIGGSGSDQPMRLRLDEFGNIYVVGFTNSKDFPTTPGVVWPHYEVDTSYFFVKLNSQGGTVFSSYIQSSGANIDVAPTTNRDWIIAAESGYPVGAQGLVVEGAGSLVLLRLSADATRLLGGVRFGSVPLLTGSDKLAGMQTDSAGNVYVAGTTGAKNFPVTENAFLRQLPSYRAGFIAKFSSTDLHVAAATYVGGTVNAAITSLAIDSKSFVYVVGNVDRAAGGDVFPTTKGAFQTEMVPGNFSLPPLNPFEPAPPATAVFVSKLMPDLSALVYSTLLAGSAHEWSSNIVIDGAGNAIVAGVTYSLDFPATGAFRTQCGPVSNAGLNRPSRGFITSLDTLGHSVSSSALLGDITYVDFVAARRTVIAGVGASLVQLSLDSGSKPSIACAVNGANFEQQSYVAPGQIITLFGAFLPADAKILFDGIASKLLYVGPAQINAVTPKGLAGRPGTKMELSVGGVRSNARLFSVRDPNPTLFIYVTPDGKFIDGGGPLAHARLSNGSLNTPTNPAKYGEGVSLYTTGLELTLPLKVYIGDNDAELIDTTLVPGTYEGVAKLKVRIPNTCCGGVQTLRIQNGPNSTQTNAGFIWVQ